MAGFQPRVIRVHAAPAYCGMSRSLFDRDVRPYLTVIPIGETGIGFDREELDAWVDYHMQRNGQPAQRSQPWVDDQKPCPASINARDGFWQIDKGIKGYGRLRESTGTRDYTEAERYALRRIDELKEAALYGVRPQRSFRQAATKYLLDETKKTHCAGCAGVEVAGPVQSAIYRWIGFTTGR